MLFGIVFTGTLHHNPNPFQWTYLADFRGLMLRMLMYKEQYQRCSLFVVLRCCWFTSFGKYSSSSDFSQNVYRF